MDLKKEAFAIGKGRELLYLLFNRKSAQDIINKLNVAIRPKDKNGRECSEFYLGVTGKIMDISAYTPKGQDIVRSANGKT